MTARLPDLMLRVAISAGLVVSGYIHADLYGRGYRFIHLIGPSFLVQAAASFALAVLLLIGPWTLRAAAAGLAVGSLVAFVLSRTTGIFGFKETGWEPAPQAALSLIVEAAIVFLCVISLAAAGILRPPRHPDRPGR